MDVRPVWGLGTHYTARLVERALCLTTDDGDCPCGSDAFAELGGVRPGRNRRATAAMPTIECENCGRALSWSVFEPPPECQNCGGTRFRPAGHG